MYERLALSPEEIATQTECALVDVKQALQKCSFKWNTAVKQGGEEDITDSEFEVIKQHYKELALTAEDESVRARCLGKLWELKKKEQQRKEDRAQMGAVNKLAEALARARAARTVVVDVVATREEKNDS